ncbi:MAG: error-prone DNA polymerase, partial [Gammaproteobacteria bacterium]|nr:error-prone DNA polymerase [Gammaproteobacteria bacterium]
MHTRAPGAPPAYAELHCLSNFSFQRGASHPEELVERAVQLGYHALALTDECSLAGVVRAHVAAKAQGLPLIIGSEFQLHDAPGRLVLLATTRQGYARLSQLITQARRRAEKGHYQLRRADLHRESLHDCLCLWKPGRRDPQEDWQFAHQLRQHCPERFWLLAEYLLDDDTPAQTRTLEHLSQRLACPIVAAGDVHMHHPQRQPLQDLLTALRHHCSVADAGWRLFPNAERHLRTRTRLARLYPHAWLNESITIAERCCFSLDELHYEYPQELVPRGHTPSGWLRTQVMAGCARRYPQGAPERIYAQLEQELNLIAELHYEHYFLTVHDIVHFARSQGILCQGRGSAANSVVCYCLGISEVDPTQVELLVERFISRERDEPPDIDVDFEHERREEVIQYLYRRYGRDRAALAATVIGYRLRSALRDVARGLGLDPLWLEQLQQGLDWRSGAETVFAQLIERGLETAAGPASQLLPLTRALLGFPRHLSQHVGGFVISAGPLADLVPIENAAMTERTVIQWDKVDLESLKLLKVDVLGLGMLSAIRRCLDLLRGRPGQPGDLAAIPREDPAVYGMLQRGDSVGVFQVESRAQMNMLPRLKPACYYDLVVQVAIVRPGPIQGDMVHPYLRRRAGLEPADYPSDAVRAVLERTLGVPIFQEQAMRLAMVAAGFSGGEADRLRRAMAAWKRTGSLDPFREPLLRGMRERGYSDDFAERLYAQLSGFGEYGFPESHAASFALLVYVSAWLKHHQPAAFCCALLNSLPMGFYSPSQLVQDARRHAVIVAPVDVNRSQIDHHLEDPPDAPRPNHLRLGLRLIKGLSRSAAQRLVTRRPEAGYRDQADLQRRCQLDRRDLEALASADALAALSGHRHQARWASLQPPAPGPVLTDASATPSSTRDPTVWTPPAPREADDIREDHHSLGLSLRRHPLALLREQQRLPGCLCADGLHAYPVGRVVRVAGLVTGRQRPGSASGVTFVTLED